jgi:hypothetical protein
MYCFFRKDGKSFAAIFIRRCKKEKKTVQGKLQLKTAASPIQGNKGENSTEEKHSHQQNSG